MIERRSHWLFILLAGVAALVGAYVLGRMSTPSAIEREGGLISADGRRPAALERGAHRPRAVTLKAAIRSQHGSAGEEAVEPLDSGRLRTSDEPDGEELDSTDVRRPLEPEEEERSVREARIAFWDKLSARVDAEPPDPAWRRETEPVITRVIPEQLGPQVSVHDVACASSLCRAKLTHPEWPRIPNDKFLQFSLNRGSLGPMEIQLDTREKGATVLYFLRREHAPAAREL
ncbi:hypothetical protein WME97_35565 [Sorangium sp. So ce367]|uniref:hypothetical protein n=1 Tax=Sorangium sp. So ce367 TaxID=3133305 RepID=UPI003F61409A